MRSTMRYLVDALEPRLRARIVERGDGCWDWIGTRTSKGYGMARVDGRTTTAHRVVYEALVGPIPPGHHLDHSCRHAGCVNPAHVEPVTPAENRRRQVMLHGTDHYLGAKTHCPAGHAYSGRNLYVYVDRDGQAHRRCLACTRQRRRERSRIPLVDVPIGEPFHELVSVVR